MADEGEQKRISSSTSNGSSRKLLLSGSASVRVTDADSLALGQPKPNPQPPQRPSRPGKLSAMLRSILRAMTVRMPIPLPLACRCKWMSNPRPDAMDSTVESVKPEPEASEKAAACLGNRVTGTLFGYRKGHVHFVVQEDPRAAPALILELATATSSLVKEMASGLVRIALECDKGAARGRVLLSEPVWTMYCNGRKSGYAIRRACSDGDTQILSMVSSVSMGAGVLPPSCNSPGANGEGELMFMRAKFERVVGSRDSEAFYMLNPDGHSGGPELSIFLLRI